MAQEMLNCGRNVFADFMIIPLKPVRVRFNNVRVRVNTSINYVVRFCKERGEQFRRHNVAANAPEDAYDRWHSETQSV